MPITIEYPVTPAVIFANALAAKAVADICPIETTETLYNEYSKNCELWKQISDYPENVKFAYMKTGAANDVIIRSSSHHAAAASFDSISLWLFGNNGSVSDEPPWPLLSSSLLAFVTIFCKADIVEFPCPEWLGDDLMFLSRGSFILFDSFDTSTTWARGGEAFGAPFRSTAGRETNTWSLGNETDAELACWDIYLQQERGGMAEGFRTEETDLWLEHFMSKLRSQND